MRGQVVGEEWEGRWEGRAVVIRTIRDRASPEAKVSSPLDLTRQSCIIQSIRQQIGPEAMVTYYPQM